MQQLTEQQVKTWIDSIFGDENTGGEDCSRWLSPVARHTTCALAGVPYVPSYSTFEFLHNHEQLRRFRSFLDEVVRVMDDCGVRPWVTEDYRQEQSKVSQ